MKEHVVKNQLVKIIYETFNISLILQGDKNMNKVELQKIKEKALEEHIPIIMDDTLKVIQKILIESRPTKILEIGTAVRVFCNMF